MRKSKYNKEILEPIVTKCRSIGQVLDQLGLKRTGGNYQNIKRHIKINGIDTSHFLGMGWNKGDTFGLVKRNTIPLSEILRKGSHYNSSRLRLRLIKEGIKKNKCELCSQGSLWNNKKLTMHLDHINGERTDNTIENLRILCPNCHSQTETYCRKENQL
jgi:Zn finger protein HypA/HybF involved in hydrogenase expression